MAHFYEYPGYCPCCKQAQIWKTESDWYRDTLICGSCGSVVRERAIALMIDELMPNWKQKSIHESSPIERGSSIMLRKGAADYVGSHYFPDKKMGMRVGQYRNENLESQTFAENTFDLVVSLDVMEHVFQPQKVYAEIYRTLKPNGYYIHTFPIQKWRVEAFEKTAKLLDNGTIQHLIAVPEYHGNPIDDKGSLVTHYYGYDISKEIAQWAPFDVRIIRFWDQYHGVIGEYTDLTVCKKR